MRTERVTFIEAMKILDEGGTIEVWVTNHPEEGEHWTIHTIGKYDTLPFEGLCFGSLNVDMIIRFYKKENLK